jgi:hypothetical protein
MVEQDMVGQDMVEQDMVEQDMFEQDMFEQDRVGLDIVELYQYFGMNNMALLEVEYFVLNYMLNLR